MTTVSAVIPTYNREETATRAVESVLGQTYKDIECLVIDDGSDDDTEEKICSIEDSRIRYVCHNTNRGVSTARNTGIKESEGEYIAFLDSDDKWAPEKIEKQLEVIQSRSGSWNSVYCCVKRERAGRVKNLFERLVPDNNGEEGGEELIGSLISMDLAVHAGSTLMVEKEAISKVGGFDDEIQRHEELEFLVRLLKEGKLAHVDEDLVTLYDSGYPSAMLLEQEKEKFLSKVGYHIAHSSHTSEEIYESHNLELAKAFFREGDWRQGLNYLRLSRVTSPRAFASLFWSVASGIK